MSWNQAYLDAVGVPRWIPRQSDEEIEAVVEEKSTPLEVIVEKSTAAETSNEPQSSLGIKALVNNPDAKLAILVSQHENKADLQKAWKQLKFAWKQWQNEELPASLFQLNSESTYSLDNLESQQLIVIDTCNQSGQIQKIEAPAMLNDKKAWWQLLQLAHEKSQLL